MERLICLLIGYFLGNIQMAYIVGKKHGIDIRQHGSGNAGSTNALRVLGKKAAAIVFIGDILKCGIAILIARFLYINSQPDIAYLYMLYAAAGTILGHNFPIILGFKGGKGIACTAGLVIFYHPILFPVAFILFIGTFLITHYVSLGSLLVYVGFIIEIIILGQMGFLGAMTTASLIELYIISFFLAAMAFIKHRKNIKRLLTHSESKTYLNKKIK